MALPQGEALDAAEGRGTLPHQGEGRGPDAQAPRRADGATDTKIYPVKQHGNF